MVIDRSSSPGPLDQENPTAAEALLDNIIEETCESLDSGGRDASQHTMKSNFNGTIIPNSKISEVLNDKLQKKKKSKTRQYKGSFTQQPVPTKEGSIGEPAQSAQTPLTERRILISNAAQSNNPMKSPDSLMKAHSLGGENRKDSSPAQLRVP